MNPGEEKRFDGLLRDKFNNFEYHPSPDVWQSVSQTFPPARPSRVQQLLPFGLGSLFGMFLTLGVVFSYQQLQQPEGPAVAATTAQAVQRPQPADAPATAPAASAAAAPAPRPAAGTATGSGSHSHTHHVTQSYEHRHYTSQSASAGLAAAAAAPAASVRTPALFTPTQTQRAATPASARAARPSAAETATVQAPQRAAATPAATPAATAARTAANPAVASAWLTGFGLDTAIAHVPDNMPEQEKTSRMKELLKAQGTVLALLQNRNDSLLAAIEDADIDSTIARVRINRQRKHNYSGLKPPTGWPMPTDWAVAMHYELNSGWGTERTGPAGDQATEVVRRSMTQDVRMRNRVNDRLSLSGGLGLTLVESELRFNRSRSVFSSNPDTTYQLNPAGDSIMVINNQELNIQEQYHQYLRPNYQFYTIPLSLHYKVTGSGHFGVSLNLGLQAAIFRSGSKPVWRDGRYQLEKVQSKNSAFRPVSLAVTSGIDLNYRFTPRLTLMAGPTLRWWAINPYRNNKSANQMLPGVQMGLSIDL